LSGLKREDLVVVKVDLSHFINGHRILLPDIVK